MATTNYSGRKIDICILGDLPYAADSSGEVTTTLDLGIGGQLCAGIVKLLQKVLIALLTYNYRYDPAWGTSLPEALTRGNLTTALNVINAEVPIVLEAVSELLRRQEFLETPLDERIDRLDLAGEVTADYDTGTISMGIRVTTLQGTTNQIVVPLKTNIT